MSVSDLTLDEQKAVIAKYRDFLLQDQFFNGTRDAVTPHGDAMCLLESDVLPLKTCLACPTSQVITVDAIAEGEDFSQLNRDAASKYCARINEMFPFQSLMLVIDYGHILSETKVVATAPPEGLAGCVQDLINLVNASRAAIVPLSTPEGATDQQLDALCNMVRMTMQGGE